MPERVVDFPIGVRWEPNAPDSVLVCESLRACLAVEPHFDDEDERMVVLVWERCAWRPRCRLRTMRLCIAIGSTTKGFEMSGGLEKS